MNNKPENPQAFPGIEGESGHGNATRNHDASGDTLWTYHNQGMTLRDYFAAKAMQGFAADPTNHKLFDDADDVAENAYRMADAMLNARVTPAEQMAIAAKSPEVA